MTTSISRAAKKIKYRQTNIVSYRTNEKKREGGKGKGNDVNLNLGKTKFDVFT